MYFEIYCFPLGGGGGLKMKEITGKTRGGKGWKGGKTKNAIILFVHESFFTSLAAG